MKQASHLFFLFLALSLYFSQSTSARLLLSNHGDQKVKADGIARAGSSKAKETTEDLSSLFGMEECEVKDEDCLKRRMVEEAHLDYIYTQHHKPKNSNEP